MGGKKGFTPEQIIGKLREAEVLLSKGSSIAEACRKTGVTDVTFHQWRKLYLGWSTPRALLMHRFLNEQNINTRELQLEGKYSPEYRTLHSSPTLLQLC